MPPEQRRQGQADLDLSVDPTIAGRSKNSRLIINGNSKDEDNQNSLESQVKNYQKKEDTVGAFLQEVYEKNKGRAPQVVIDKIRK